MLGVKYRYLFRNKKKVAINKTITGIILNTNPITTIAPFIVRESIYMIIKETILPIGLKALFNAGLWSAIKIIPIKLKMNLNRKVKTTNANRLSSLAGTREVFNISFQCKKGFTQ